MAHQKIDIDVKPGKFELSQTAKGIFSVMAFLGLVAFAAALGMDKERAWHSFLTSYFYFVSLAVGGLFFTALQFISNAGWSVNIRRFVESLTSFLPHVAIATIVLLFGMKDLYLWTDLDVVAGDPILSGKQSYLNTTFFVIRLAVFFAIWLMFKKFIIGNSLKQDKDGDTKWTIKNGTLSVAFLLLFALSYSVFSVDMMMSLEPHWFSTIFGVYCFAGLFQSTMAMTILLILHCMKRGLLKGIVTIDHVHDLAKFLKGFTVFWAYIAFSQYMLIWYANLPEETIFFIHRSNGAWVYLSLGLLVFKFVVPFIALLPRWAKRTPTHLSAVCILILVMQYVDIYWLVYPNLSHDKVYFGWQEVGVFLGFMGLFLLTVTRFLSKNSLTPIKDPRRHESFGHHVTY